MCPLCNTCKAWNMSEICTMAKVRNFYNNLFIQSTAWVRKQVRNHMCLYCISLHCSLATCSTIQGQSSSVSSCPSGLWPFWNTGRGRCQHWLITGTAWISTKKRFYTLSAFSWAAQWYLLKSEVYWCWSLCPQERPRPEFAAMAPRMEQNPVTGVKEPYFPEKTRLSRMFTGSMVIIMMVRLDQLLSLNLECGVTAVWFELDYHGNSFYIFVWYKLTHLNSTTFTH